ncbi:hypothetical protein D3C78_748610 [compost metagenome]
MAEQHSRSLRHAAMARPGPFGAGAGEMAGQLDVLPHREERQQVELLEDVAGVVYAEVVAARRGEPGDVLVEQADAAALRLLHAAEQAEQGGLAAAGGALEEQGFAALQTEFRDIQQFRLAGPGEAEVVDFDQCVHGMGLDQNSRRLLAALRSPPFWPCGPITCDWILCMPGKLLNSGARSTWVTASGLLQVSR